MKIIKVTSFVILSLLISSCKSMKIKKSSEQNISIASIDAANKSVFVELKNNSSIKHQELKQFFKLKPKSESYKNGDSIILKNNKKYGYYKLIFFSENLVSNANCYKTGSKWKYGRNTNVIEKNGQCIYEVINYKSDSGNKIGQRIDFKDKDYGDKFLLFICTATTEKFIEKSITRIPYLWGRQYGDFQKEEWVFMEDNVTFKGPANKWEKTYGIRKLLKNVESVWIQMSQGHMKGDDPDGTKSKYFNMEVRIFEKEDDAKYYVENIYK